MCNRIDFDPIDKCKMCHFECNGLEFVCYFKETGTATPKLKATVLRLSQNTREFSVELSISTMTMSWLIKISISSQKDESCDSKKLNIHNFSFNYAKSDSIV